MTAELKDDRITEPTDAPYSPPEQTPDLEVILAEPGELTIQGIPVLVNRIKSNEFFALIGILTTGLGGRMGSVMESLQDADDPEESQAALLSMFVVAVPKALPEFGKFLKTITEPKNEPDRARLALALENPEIGDLLDLLGVLAIQEKDDLFALVGKARAWISKIAKVYQKPTPTVAG